MVSSLSVCGAEHPGGDEDNSCGSNDAYITSLLAVRIIALNPLAQIDCIQELFRRLDAIRDVILELRS